MRRSRLIIATRPLLLWRGKPTRSLPIPSAADAASISTSIPPTPAHASPACVHPTPARTRNVPPEFACHCQHLPQARSLRLCCARTGFPCSWTPNEPMVRSRARYRTRKAQKRLSSVSLPREKLSDSKGDCETRASLAGCPPETCDRHSHLTAGFRCAFTKKSSRNLPSSL